MVSPSYIRSQINDVFLIPFCFGFSGLLLWIAGSIATMTNPFLFVALLLQLVAIVCVWVRLTQLARATWRKSLFHKVLVVIGVCIFVSHAIGILLPETGFDALWYHLPIVQDMAISRTVRFSPLIPQSNQPRLGELVFLPWYVLGGVTGVKIATYAIFLSLVLLVYRLSRLYVEEEMALLLTLLISTFHILSWGATSAYVDILRTLFEVGALYFLVKNRQSVAIPAFLLGFSLITKLLSLLFSPAFFILAGMQRSKSALVGCLLALILCSTVLFQGWKMSGIQPLTFFLTVGNDLIVQGSEGNMSMWIAKRVGIFLTLPIELSFHSESYMSSLFLFSLPFIYISRHELWRMYRNEWVFLFVSFFIWICIPPLSTRYDLTAIILATILCASAVIHVSIKQQWAKLLLILFILSNIALNMSVRMAVHVRSLPYLLGKETQEQYLSRYDTDIMKGPLESWYKHQ